MRDPHEFLERAADLAEERERVGRDLVRGWFFTVFVAVFVAVVMGATNPFGTALIVGLTLFSVGLTVRSLSVIRGLEAELALLESPENGPDHALGP